MCNHSPSQQQNIPSQGTHDPPHCILGAQPLEYVDCVTNDHPCPSRPLRGELMPASLYPNGKSYPFIMATE
ncbi:hypothetical protein [Pseudomonas phage vB_PaeM_RP14]|nr:hypothetical protein [Pseudomonas phage vB_PaeM_RP14]